MKSAQRKVAVRMAAAFVVGVVSASATMTAAAVEQPQEVKKSEPVKQIVYVEKEVPSETQYAYLGNFRLTAYCPCEICCGEWAKSRPVDEHGEVIVTTATGERAAAGVTVAVDPTVIPYGTELMIAGHTYTAQDCGGAIKGNRIDVYFDSHEAARNFGVQYSDVYCVS